MKLTLSLLSTMLLGIGALSAADAPAGPPSTYPLQKCVVSGEKLGDMGKPFKVTHEGTDVWLCCKNCLKDFNKEPAKFTEQVKKAEKK